MSENGADCSQRAGNCHCTLEFVAVDISPFPLIVLAPIADDSIQYF